jgi:Ca-activated chloride channel homolog
MAKRYLICLLFFAGLLSGTGLWIAAQEGKPDDAVIHKVVEMVQLNVAVTDTKGNYVTGLSPSDFVITEDRMPEKLATFEEGNEAPQIVTSGDSEPKVVERNATQPTATSRLNLAAPPPPPEAVSEPLSALVSGASVFILFDTSNYMYRSRGFVFAQDSIAEFVRSLDAPDRVALYSYSRDFSRETPLTSDRSDVLRGVRATVNGDDCALYNALLLTLKDAAQYTGRKVVVVFSNGPDNASMVPPEDVGELAQSEGIPIYMVSTLEAKLDPVSSAVFGRISSTTGGEAYFAGDWKDQQKAFTAIRDDLAHLYLLSYYPLASTNRGWRTITVKLVGDRLKKYHLRTRSGYRPLPERASTEAIAAP